MSETSPPPGGLPAVLRLPWLVASAAVDVAERVPLAGGAIRAAREGAQGGVGAAAIALTRSSLRTVIVAVVDEVTAALNLTELIVDNVDLNRIIGAVDLNAVLGQLDLDALFARIDINALIARLDLDGLVGGVDLDALIARVDLDAIIGVLDIGEIVDRVEIDAIIDRVDVDAIVARVDIDAIIARIDLIGLADVVIDGVHLPDIIREASTSVTADVMTDVRGTSERADDAVADLVNRMLRRKSTEARDNG